ncbi:4F5 domain protein [Aspergillus ibericus CBS 121593]|uniref:Small EDRK-rich factor-like N-terminal domain-containing protein n=1 Tax=Aspergillus ibericus CBS 121593 TaxID=1448316 RepID=A0A395HDI1_9EURO|nr:hypothetical protein BO80DRAFT_79485 [Aspergillus ibericus CBS 121593]RAL05726.1 hypothetical protein BO80DRAFT_79485 [Aspergillus ibericus CBS 121593]
MARGNQRDKSREKNQKKKEQEKKTTQLASIGRSKERSRRTCRGKEEIRIPRLYLRCTSQTGRRTMLVYIYHSRIRFSNSISTNPRIHSILETVPRLSRMDIVDVGYNYGLRYGLTATRGEGLVNWVCAVGACDETHGI